jgi:dihydroxy-acid dehydratase
VKADLAPRKAGWTPPPPKYRGGVLGKYASLVTSASEGAVTRPGGKGGDPK